MKCEKCGNEIADGMAFCPGCGSKAIPTIQLGKCAKCNADIPAESKFCAVCGAPALVQDLKCRNCGMDIPEGSRFCPKCGTASTHLPGLTPSAKGGSIPGSGTPASSDASVENVFQYFIQGVTKKYADFSGRARRREFWFYALFSFIISFVLGFIPVLGWLAGLALFIPALAIEIRRLHDIGKSGTYLLFALIPIVGAILLIVWFCREGDQGPNQYGPDPKAAL